MGVVKPRCSFPPPPTKILYEKGVPPHKTLCVYVDVYERERERERERGREGGREGYKGRSV